MSTCDVLGVTLFQLAQGILVEVSPSLIKRRKTHFHTLPCGASLILGNNGYIWICPTINEDTDNTGGFVQNLEVSVAILKSHRRFKDNVCYAVKVGLNL